MKKNILQLLSSNIISLIYGIVINLLIPAYVSINSYADIKTYLFYMSYIGFLSFGYIDGAYIFFGGKKYNEIQSSEIYNSKKIYGIIELGLAVVALLAGLVLRNVMVMLCGVGLLTNNIGNYYKNLTMAIGEFKVYSFAIIFEQVIQLVAFCSLIFIVHSDNYLYFCLVYIFVGVFESLYIPIKLRKSTGSKSHELGTITSAIKLMKIGIPFMISNISFSLFTGLDRWFVKFLMGSREFAMYSFAASMETIINAFMSPISNALYNSIAKGMEKEQIRRYQRYLLIYGFFIALSAFAGKFLISVIMPKYNDSVSVIIILFVSQIFHCVIISIYVNLYKAENRPGIMLRQLIMMLIFGTVANAVGYCIEKAIVIFALMTLLTRIVWMIICEKENKEYQMSKKDIIYTTILTLGYVIVGMMSPPLISLVICSGIFIVASFILMKEETLVLIKAVLKHGEVE